MNGINLIELIQNLLAPPLHVRALARIKKITETNKYYVIYFKNLRAPLYFPRHINISNLYQVIGELYNPFNAHYYESENTRVVKNDIVLDCGAAEGLFSLLKANKCKKIYAIEPLPDFIKSLKKTFKGFRNVKIIPFALSDKERRGFLSESGISSFLTKKKGIPVKVTSIDNLFYKNIPVSYIKADLEGSELEMLKGAVKTIKKNRPKIAIAIYHKKEHGRQIEKLLKKMNKQYRIEIRGLILHAWVE
jgi:FkbM family methyltransferase